MQTSNLGIRKVAATPTSLTEVEKLSRSKEEPWKKSTQAAGLKRKEKKALTRQPATSRSSNTTKLGQHQKIGRRDPSMSLNEWNNRKRELQYLKDPLELANFVKKELMKDKATEMVHLVRMASHSMQCIVSWNHLIDYYLAKEKVTHALKIYNDVGCSF